jgi:cell division protein FtsW
MTTQAKTLDSNETTLVSSFDHVLAAVVFILIGIGTVMVYSSSTVIASAKFSDASFFMTRHAEHLAAALVLFVIAYKVPITRFEKHAAILLFASVLLLTLPLLIGATHKGAQRWISVFGVSFQPSEVVKLALIFFLAERFSKQQERLKSFAHGLLPHLVILAIALGLIVAEPDLSTSVAIALIVGTIMVAAQVRARHLLLLGGALLGFVALLIAAEPYRMSRLTGYMSGDTVGSSASYQIQQGFVAMGSGGFFGRGLGRSLQKYFYLPEPYTDSILPIIGEELGLIGTISVVMLFATFGWRGVTIARRQNTLFRFLLAIGLTANIMVYATLNMAVVTGLLPATGLPLPFVSYGGTSLAFNLVAVGWLLNLSRGNNTTQNKGWNVVQVIEDRYAAIVARVRPERVTSEATT